MPGSLDVETVAGGLQAGGGLVDFASCLGLGLGFSYWRLVGSKGIQLLH